MQNLQVYLAPGATDLRKSINGLSVLVDQVMDLNPFSGAVFGFCNRDQTLIKLLYWDHNGFCIWMKKLEAERFRWPNLNQKTVEVTQRELSWLLDGLSLHQKEAHRALQYDLIS